MSQGPVPLLDVCSNLHDVACFSEVALSLTTELWPAKVEATKLGHSWSHGHSHHMVTIRGIQLGGLALSMLFHRKRARGRKLCRKPFLYYGDRSSILNAGWRFCAPLPCFSHAKRVRGHCAENRCDDRIVDYLTLGGASVHGL